MDIDRLSESEDAYTKKLFSIMQGAVHRSNIAGDSSTPIYILSQSAIDEMRALTESEISANYTLAGIHTQSLDEAFKDSRIRVTKMLGDQVFNERTNAGTLIDPSVYTHTTTPVMMGMHEETALYASGGLPSIIMDKKTHAMFLNGMTFKYREIKDTVWDADKVEMLEEAAETTGANTALGDGVTDSYIYGGSIAYPIFKGESPTSLLRPMDKLNLEKGCIDRWVSIDRWNITTIPSYKEMQKDYINPKTMFIPQECVEIDTSRMAILRPKPMPYWAVLYNLGWSPSDFCGWMAAYYDYAITMKAIPVMAQQMSLLLYKMPLDALNATLSRETVEKLMALNEEKMSEWSATNPKAVNMVGEVEVVNRTYSGLDHFIGSMKSNLAAQCDVPEPTLWHTPNKGFSDNTNESLLKQSESQKLNQSFIERSMRPTRDALIAHVFGKDSKEWEHRDELHVSLNKPIISTEKDLAETGARFAASVSSLVQAGITPDTAMEISKSFFPSVKINQSMIAAAKKSFEEQQKMQLEMGQQKMQQFGGQSNSGPKTQAPNNGHFTAKAGK